MHSICRAAAVGRAPVINRTVPQPMNPGPQPPRFSDPRNRGTRRHRHAQLL